MVTATQPGMNATAILHAATDAAARGWPVVPGTYPHRDRWYGALELPPAIPATLPDLDHDVLGAPIALVFPPPRWLVLVTPGAPVRPDLAAAGVRLRTIGDWVPLPPTHLGGLRARWRVPPSDQSLPSSAQVQRTLAHALHRAGRP